MSDVTAIVLSSRPYLRTWPGLCVLVSTQTITSFPQFNDARINAIRAVGTPSFFFLDDDDELPDDYERVLRLCLAADASVAYTDRVVDGERVASRPYSQQAHLADPRLVHQLALYRTSSARAALHRLPRGEFYPELSLAWEVAKSGAVHIPEIGYHWKRGASGMHTWPQASIAQMRTRLWCKENP
jgi:hypothetical protein